MAITNSILTNSSAANVYVSVGNTAITARTFDVYACPSGNTAGFSNLTRIYSGVQIQTGDTYVVDNEKLILGNGDMIRANCSAATAIAMTVSYIGI